MLVVNVYVFQLMLNIGCLIVIVGTPPCCVENAILIIIVIDDVNVSLIVPANLCHVDNVLLLRSHLCTSKINLNNLHISVAYHLLLETVHHVLLVQLLLLLLFLVSELALIGSLRPS
jgi:hypothetical protein